MIGPIFYRGGAGYLTPEGEFRIPPIFERLGEIREGKVSFIKSGRLGFLDEAGRIVLEPQFESEKLEMPHFIEGMCAVRLNGALGYIDHLGQWIIGPQFEHGWDFRGGRCLAETKGDQAHYCVINRVGNEISRITAEIVPGLQNWPENWNCFPVFVCNGSEERLTQWINWRDEVVFPARYRRMTNWCDGISGFLERDGDEMYGLVKKSGEVLRQPFYYDMEDFYEGLAGAGRSPKEFGFINSAGEWVIDPKYRHVQRFSEGLACVSVKNARRGNKCYINRRDEVIIEPRFNRAASFKDGFAQVEYEGKHGVIDKTGRVIWEAQIELE